MRAARSHIDSVYGPDDDQRIFDTAALTLLRRSESIFCDHAKP